MVDWVLRVIAGPSQGTRYALTDGAVLGRAKSAAIHLDAKSVSRRHAELLRGTSGWTISDLGSSNGTWVNGTRVTSPTALRLSDQVQVGEVVMLVETGLPEDDMAEAPTAFNLPVQKRSSS
jgi:pSer/pThr/pTyr-binding forkhead associated (FHA) protein